MYVQTMLKFGTKLAIIPVTMECQLDYSVAIVSKSITDPQKFHKIPLLAGHLCYIKGMYCVRLELYND